VVVTQGKYLSLEEARKAGKLDRFCKEHPSEGNAQREEVAAAAEKFESHKALFFSVSRNDGTEA
jgi:hypothetical protein